MCSACCLLPPSFSRAAASTSFQRSKSRPKLHGARCKTNISGAPSIPNLVETVRGYARQEREVLTQVIEARAKATQVQVRTDQLTDPEALRKFQEAQSQLSGALGRLIAVSENYPDLKSNQNFLALQSQLEGTENRIAVARRDYIQAVQAYNTETRTFPGRLWAIVYGAKPMATFTTSEENQRPPQVKF